MRVVKYLSIGLVVCLALVVLPWLLKFADVVGLSSSSNDWANFGSYIGGTFSSLVSALALLALLYTITQQHKQIEVLRNRAIVEDMLKSIDRLERDLERVLDGVSIDVEYLGATRSVLVRDILFKPSQSGLLRYCPSEREILDYDKRSRVEPEHLAKINLYEVIGLAAAELNQIRMYSEALKKIESKVHSNVLSRYYYRKYRLAYGSLYEHGALKEVWEDQGF